MIERGSRSRQTLGLLWQVLRLQGGFLLLLSVVRLLYLRFAPAYETFPWRDFLSALWLGLRIDLVLVAYLSIVPYLLLLANVLLFHRLPQKLLRILLVAWFVALYLLVLGLAGADMAFYSYFGEHMNTLVFGVIDDDTRALLAIARKNYNLWFIGGLIVTVVLATAWGVWRWLWRPVSLPRGLPWWGQLLLWPALAVAIFFAARGSLGTFPLIKDVPEVSADPFINALPMNGVLAFQKASEQYLASKADRRDLAAEMGYRNALPRAVSDFLERPLPSGADPFQALMRRTPPTVPSGAGLPDVVVVMVESFGLPILRYQSPTFDILGRLRRHFAEDMLFENILSGGNGTIASLEPMLLNVLPRGGSVPLSQSTYQRVAFPFAAARVFQAAGYETRFVYGGDLSWRNIGPFLRRQGFDRVEGKSAIRRAIADTRAHDWGVFDEYTYRYVLQLLQTRTRPRFIFVLTTNNHPPFTVPDDYAGPPLTLPEELRRSATGDLDLLARRLRDYQYALDAAGGFLDRLKAEGLARRTVVAITGDNNTIEGVMHYADPLAEAKRVPFYLHLPAPWQVADYDSRVAGSHKDIFPTLYNRLLPDRPYLALGTDLLDTGVRHCGFNDAGIIVAADGAFRLGKARTDAQRRCERQYRSGVAVTDFLLRAAREGTLQGID